MITIIDVLLETIHFLPKPFIRIIRVQNWKEVNQFSYESNFFFIINFFFSACCLSCWGNQAARATTVNREDRSNWIQLYIRLTNYNISLALSR